MEKSVIDSAWCVRDQSKPDIEALQSSLKLPELVARALVNRSVTDEESARRYLSPSTAHIEDPFAFREMEAAVDRIQRALRDDEKIVIQGDYDVDGSTSAAILANLFRILGSNASVSIPSRAKEGYGLNENAIRRAKDDGVSLLITCDNGTTALSEIALAKSLGIDTIVTDHHTVGPELPDTVALLNPHVEGETVAFRDLCGAGVAFKLAWAVLQRAGSGGSDLSAEYRDFLAASQSLVALACIADVVPLMGENRVFTRNGLGLMVNSPNPGIRALMQQAKVEKVPTGTDVGFKLAPRLNAGGRMGRETLSFELLTAGSFGDAVALAREADALNSQRQTLDRELTNIANQMIDDDPGYSDDRILVLGHDRFEAGVVGIVASRLMRKYNKPAVLVATNGETGRGSGRSIPGFHLYNALNEVSAMMNSFGGHALAAGLDIDSERIPELRREVNRVADKHILDDDYDTPTLDIDAECTLDQIDFATVNWLHCMEPFGEGNPQPVFMASDVTVVGTPNVVGRGKGHLKLKLRQGDVVHEAIGFSMGPEAEKIPSGDSIQIAFTPTFNEWRNQRTIQLEIKDIQRG